MTFHIRMTGPSCIKVSMELQVSDFAITGKRQLQNCTEGLQVMCRVTKKYLWHSITSSQRLDLWHSITSSQIIIHLWRFITSTYIIDLWHFITSSQIRVVTIHQIKALWLNLQSACTLINRSLINRLHHPSLHLELSDTGKLIFRWIYQVVVFGLTPINLSEIIGVNKKVTKQQKAI